MTRIEGQGIPPTTRVAVMVPCFNEQATIATVVADFKATLPYATIYVYDNNSLDRTVEAANTAGAVVCRVSRQGKGEVIRRMFADIEADIYVLVDGDDTYDARSSRTMIDKLLADELDMVVGCRESDEEDAYRPGHRFGNRLLTRCVTWIFGRGFRDILSGYRVFSRRYVKSFQALASGFETETELTVHALQLRMPVDEVSTPYKSRPAGSASKLRTFRDGRRILMTIFKLAKNERPFAFFGLAAVCFALISIALAVPLLITYLDTGLVPRLPTALLATGLMLVAVLSLTCGLILDTVTRGRQELKRLFYLSIPLKRSGAP